MIIKSFNFLILILICLSANIIHGQQQVVTKSGQEITIFPNGKWEKTVKNAEEIVTNSQIFEVPQVASSTLKETDVNEIQSMISDLESIEANSRVQMELSYKSIQLIELERDLAKSNKNDEEFQKANDILNLEKGKVRVFEDYQDDSYDLIKKLNKLYKKGSKDYLKDINKIKETANEKLGTTYILKEKQVVFEPKIKKEKNNKRINKNRSQNIYDCNIIFDDYDATLGQNRKSTSLEHFFEYTHPKTKVHFKTNNFLNAEVNTAKIGDYYYLNLMIKMASKDALKSYGYIPKNEKIWINLISGERVTGNSIMISEGVIEPYSGASTYDVRYRIDKNDFNKLADKEIRSIGILWSSGYEEYNVYNIDLVKNQAQCILN